MENIVVGAVVTLAGIWVGLGFFRRRKTRASCDSGCSGCGGSSTRAPQPQPLVQIRR